MGALGILGAPLQDPAPTPAFLLVVAAFFFFAVAGLVVSTIGAFRRWRARRRLEKLAAQTSRPRR